MYECLVHLHVIGNKQLIEILLTNFGFPVSQSKPSFKQASLLHTESQKAFSKRDAQ